MECVYCGCPDDDCEPTDAGVQCLCGVRCDGVDSEDLAWGFHMVEISDAGEDGWIE